MGFRARQIATLTFVAAAVALATVVVSAALMARTKVAAARGEAGLLANVLYEQASRVISKHPEEEFRQALFRDEALRNTADAMIGHSPTVLYVAITDHHGAVLFHSNQRRDDAPLDPAVHFDEFAELTPLAQLWALYRPQPALVVDAPFSIDGERPYGDVRVAFSPLLLRRDLSATITRYTLIAAGAVLFAFLTSLYFVNRWLAPLEVLREKLARIDLGEDQPPLDLRTKMDVNRIAEFFDSLSERLASHERPGGSGPSTQALLAGLNDAVIVLTADKALLSLNESAQRLLGAGATPIGSRLDELLSHDHPVLELVDEALRQGRVDAVRSVPLADERNVDYLLSAHVLRETQAVSGVLVTARDMHSMSHLVSQLSYAQKLASLGRLTSGVAHEVRNPLNAMTLTLELLRKKIATNSPDVGNHVDVLEEELGRLNRVVRNFLEFSRPEQIDLQRLGVEEVVRTAINRVRPLADARRVELHFARQGELPRVIANSHLLEQAFVNLLTNSYEAMPHGGRIDVSASAPVDGRVEIVVEDTGVGIPQEKISDIFDLYFTTKQQGSGVGLSLVYRIVQLHGGEVDVESAVGHGTRVRISLPQGSA